MTGLSIACHGTACVQVFDCCVIESTGISLPLPVAATFAMMQDDQQQDSKASTSSSSSGATALQQVAMLDTLVTVVDGQRFVQDVLGSELLQDRGLHADDDDERTVAELLIEQVGGKLGICMGVWQPEGIASLTCQDPVPVAALTPGMDPAALGIGQVRVCPGRPTGYWC